MLKTRHLFFILPLATVLGGCGPELSDEQSGETAAQAEPQVGTETQELGNLGAFSWAAPAPASPMGPSGDRVCFFNRIRGRFDSGADSVRIYASNGSWYVDGTGGGTSPIARCAPTPPGSVSGDYSWVAAQALPTNLGPTTGRVCFLTRVVGSFNSSADWVRVYASGGSWFLFGASQKKDGSAKARCVSVSTYTGEYSWQQGEREVIMVPTAGNVCALTYMRGAFQGGAESIYVTASAGYWYLGGASQQSGVATKARCF